MISRYIEQGDIQSIVASVGDENTVVESATLAYHRESDGKTYQADVSEYKDHAMLFKISYEESAETGVYILDSLTYVVDGESTYRRVGKDLVLKQNME